MNDATESFFNELGRRGHEALLEKATGTVRFDLARGGRTDSYLVAIKKGDVAVSSEDAAADVVVAADRAVFNSLVSGEANGMAALLRGALTFDGDPRLLLLFQRLFAEQSGLRAQQVAPRGARRRS